MGDRYQRGSPWERDVAKYFCHLEDSPDPTMPMGSPVLDYLVTGIDENIRQVSAALSEYANVSKEGKSNLSASSRLQSTVDEGMPAQAVANWVQCENPSCLKWRKLPWHVDVDLLPENFFCKDNIWNPKSKTCNASEDEWDMDDAPVKFDLSANDDNFEIGMWFDVQRKGKVGYHEGQVMELDFKSHVKRVKFHFWKLSSDRDEWIDVGSPRIAPHHSYTPRPLEGYGNKTSDRKKCSNGLSSSNVATGALPQKRKIDHFVLAKSSECTEATVDESKTAFQFEKSTIDHLNSWVSHHSANPFPSISEKERIIADTGLSKRQLGDWMARARKKLRRTTHQLNKHSNQDKAQTPGETFADVTSVKSIQSSPTKVENLLLALRNPLPQQNRCHEGTEQGSVQETIQAMQHQTAIEDTFKSAEKVCKSTQTELAGERQLGGEKLKTPIKELETYMKRWLSCSENKGNLMPSLDQKEKIIEETGIEKKRLEGWFFRARKKMKKQDSRTVSQVSHKPGTTSTALNEDLNNKTNMGHILPPTGINLMLMTVNESSHISGNVVNKNTPEKVGEANTFHVRSNPEEKSPGDFTLSVSSAVKGLTDEAKRYLKSWLSEHSSNPYPSREEKNTMLSCLGIENARGAKMLEGWFCRARKKMKQSSSSNFIQLKTTKKSDVSHVGGNPTSLDEHMSRSSCHNSYDTNDIDQSEESFTTSSNFTSLLNAAKSELGVNSRTEMAAPQPPIEAARFSLEDSSSRKLQQIHVAIPPRAAKLDLGTHSSQSSPACDIMQPSGKTASHQSIEASKFQRTESLMIKGSQNPQESTVPNVKCLPHELKSSTSDINNEFRSLGTREQAILSSFQSLQSVEIHDQPSVEYTSYQHRQGQQGAPLANDPLFQHSQGQQDALPSGRCQQDLQQVPPINHTSCQFLPGQQQASPANYLSYQHLQAQQHVSPVECLPNQHSQSHASPTADFPPYQHSQGHLRASPVDCSVYNQSHHKHQAHPSDYLSYTSSSFGDNANGSHPQANVFHLDHSAYEQNPNSTYQH